MSREVTVKFEDDNETFYLISDDGLIAKQNTTPKKIDILIVKAADRNKILEAIKMNYKLFECKDKNKEECLTKVLNSVFPYCKICRFM
ncbi:hypothetical protein GFS03_00100 [Sulfolobus sp. E5-1-F]|uniref:hypothetical protein n=1 Tax=Saccharolobus sp. E5-1-F TaxID=2663019 RepID=UPI0012961288|nr:hypothetical protein [Sulfolobus sp. E5-1-F]QGA53115.1 hypothetical protein GFS03_00100 [Sulfolobus sp. E5-1-F]